MTYLQVRFFTVRPLRSDLSALCLQAEFDSVMRKETDVVRREQLSKEKEIFNTSMKNWASWQELEGKAEAAEKKAAAKEKRIAGKTVVDPGNEDMGGMKPPPSQRALPLTSMHRAPGPCPSHPCTHVARTSLPIQ